ncbi:Uma2 family endonuclease [Spirulina sp. CS-785/01]|uniref:Uma2 family endonuclease n=1 Tax=Spirulina sp. CS-785/01 TaxID=3021716 RepID=UPI00232AB2A4|nr:Uma2 family endonuclease [Spirulina sp. CS-785/01]MDB9313903.1 Uma2 family endonuclease [Spirulina sp. CS-785/01]
MIIESPPKLYSREEYLELEETAEYKNEYHNGQIIPMTGGTTEHNRLALNFCNQFLVKFEEHNYPIFIGDVKVHIPAHNIDTYPDVMILKDEPIYDQDKHTVILNPTVIVEVLSQSTQNYDKGEKFEYYRSLSSFQEYVLIDQYKYQVEQYIKQGEGEWLFKEYKGQDCILNIVSFSWQIALSKLYKNVKIV